jgi:Holliday junction DNA helicase RuvA
MFAYIKGALISTHASSIVVEVNGIGYYLYVPFRLLQELPALGSTIQFHTSFVIRENSQALYGFLSAQERDIFEILLNVSGVGPKLALSLIGHLTFGQLQTAIIYQDLPTLCRVPGVGKKTAERLVVELKDKLTQISHCQESAPVPAFRQCAQDGVLALINLGYHQSAAQKAIKQSLQELSEDADLPLLITTALKKIKN